jgi:hypothetical protein
MDSLWETLTNFAPAQAAAHSNKQLDLAIKDHVVAVNRLVTSQRQLISANARQIFEVRAPTLMFSCSMLMQSFRGLIPPPTPSPSSPSSTCR